MDHEDKIRSRLAAIGKGVHHDSNDGEKRAVAVAVLRTAKLLWPNGDPYVDRLKDVVEIMAKPNKGWDLNDGYQEAKLICDNMIEDIDAGLATSLTARAQAEVFDDLIDHAQHYYRDGNKQGAGVLGSSVFEDCIRRIARRNDVEEKDVKLDEIISRLAKKGVFPSVKAKLCRASAGVRNSALHAQWDDFDLNDVSTTLSLVRTLLVDHLDG